MIGQRQRRVEDAPLLTGSGRYVEDVRRPDQRSLMLVRSPHPHARIVSIDTHAAAAAPGVLDVLTGADVAELPTGFLQRSLPDIRQPRCPVLALDEVRYVGEPVAAVLASSPAAAADACELIEVDYAPLPGVSDAEAALAPDAPLVHAELGSNVAYQASFGAADEAITQALAAAEHVVSLRIHSPRIAALPLEPRVFLAEYAPASDQLTVHASTQAPYALRSRLAEALGLAPEQVRVIARDVGGGFGVKSMLYREDVLAAFLARKHGCGVAWTATRGEDLVATQQARDQLHLVEAAFSASGELRALRARIITGLGAYLSQSAVVSGWRAGRLICGPYRVPLARTEVTGVFTTTPPTGVYRGAGRPEATLSIEQLMDAAAASLGIDPAEIRRRNLLQPAELPWTTPTGVTYDSGDYPATLAAALELADYPGLRAQAAEAHRHGELLGVGLCAFVDPSGGPGGEGGRVRIQTDGSVGVYSGSFPQGQGHATTFAQIVADRLQVPFDRVRVIQGDTDQVPFGVGTFAARSTPLGGSAVHVAAGQVLEQLREQAAELLEVPASDLAYTDGGFHPVGVPGRTVSLAQAAAAAEPSRREATVHFEEPREPHAHGCHVCLVRVDPETGRVSILRYVAVDDAGVLINPLIVEGQLHGGLAQGIGQALAEQVAFAADGTLLSASLADYCLLRAADLPSFGLEHTVSPSPFNPIGAKGIGESGAVAAPAAVAAAVLDALSRGAPRPTTLTLPLTPETLWRHLRS